MVRATLIASLALIVSLVTSACVWSRAYVTRGEQPLKQARTLEVTGAARARIRSDLALWTIRVVGEAPTLPEAYERLAAAVGAVQGFLAARGLVDVSLGPIDTDTQPRGAVAASAR